MSNEKVCEQRQPLAAVGVKAHVRCGRRKEPGDGRLTSNATRISLFYSTDNKYEPMGIPAMGVMVSARGWQNGAVLFGGGCLVFPVPSYTLSMPVDQSNVM